MHSFDRSEFVRGYRDGIPIGIGYLAVSFSLGITARECGFTAFQGFIASITTIASAGEYIGFTLFAANATLLQLIIMTLITNARYMLMGFALAQRLPENASMKTRLFTGVSITDEIFGITIARPGYVNPFYSFGACCMAAPLWAVGTALGISMGNILPARVVSALGVAIFGMFIAIIIPACRKDRAVMLAVVVSFAASFFIRYIPVLSTLSAGNRTIILTLLISAGAALLFPVKDTDSAEVSEP